MKKGGGGRKSLHLLRTGPSQQDFPTWTAPVVGSLHLIPFNAWAMVSYMYQLGQALVPSYSNTHLGLLWRYLVNVVNICNQLTLSKGGILDNMGGPPPITGKSLRVKLSFPCRRRNTAQIAASAPAWVSTCQSASWISDVPASTIL